MGSKGTEKAALMLLLALLPACGNAVSGSAAGSGSVSIANAQIAELALSYHLLGCMDGATRACEEKGCEKEASKWCGLINDSLKEKLSKLKI